MVTTALNINLTPGGVPLHLHVTQDDVGLREYVFTPYASPGTLDYTGWNAAAFTIEATKPDGNAIVNNCTYNSSTHEITYALQEQLCAVIGKTWSKLYIRDTGGNVLGSAAIIWIVEPAGVTSGATMSDSDISAVQEFIDEFGSINAYKSALDACLATAGGTRVAATKAAMTDHNVVYVYTGSESGMVTNNWYWYNGSAWVSGGAYQASVATDATLTTANKAADAKATGDAVAELKAELFGKEEDTFSYLVADAILDRTAPLMANTKYGIKTHVPFKKLAFAFTMSFGKSCTVTYAIKDANGTVYGDTVSKTYTIETSGESRSIYIEFEFGTPLAVGQYYLWMMSNQSGSMSYGYNSATFPTYQYLEPTPDGGYNGNVGSSTVTNYRMLIESRISGIALVDAPSIDSRNVYVKNESITGTLVLGQWTKSGNVLSLNYQSSTGNTWFTYELDVSKAVKNLVKVTGIVEMASGNQLRLYVFGTSTSGSTLYLQCGDLATAGDFSFVVDLNNFVIYNNLDLTKTVKIGFANQSRPCVASITDFDCVAYETSVPEEDVFEALDNLYTKTEANALSITAMVSAVGIVKSPNGTPYIIAVSNDGTLGTIKAIPDKTLFIGNSLLTGNGAFGMNATESTKDYYYYVTQKILDNNDIATFDKMSGTGFESCTSVASANTWMSNTLLSHLSNDLDLVIVQLGDNVNNLQMIETFTVTCKSLIDYIREHAPNARVIWVGEWYSTAQKQQIIADSCSATGITFVDISALNAPANKSYIGAVIHKASSSTTTYTVDDVTDDSTNHILTVKFTVNGNQYSSQLPYTSYTLSGTTLSVTSEYVITTLSGIASHPGNSGMKEVASAILNSIGLA